MCYIDLGKYSGLETMLDDKHFYLFFLYYTVDLNWSSETECERSHSGARVCHLFIRAQYATY